MNVAAPALVPFARKGGHAILPAAFAAEVAGLAARLPDAPFIINLCTDRYRFCAGLAAAMQRGKITLLPPNTLPATLAMLAQDYPGGVVLSEGGQSELPGMVYPDDLAAAGWVPCGGAGAGMADAAPAVILFTSGSTGRPKPAVKSFGTLRESARGAAAALGLDALRGATIIGTVPHHHSYGLESMILLRLHLGLTIDAGWPLYPADIRAALAAAPPPRILVTTPVHLRALLAEPEDLPQTALILCATAPLPVELAVAAEARFGGRLMEIYGCTEAGQVATRRTAQETQWRCLAGVSLEQDDQGTWASGKAVPGRVLLHDAIELTGASRFRLGARAADLVEVAGKRASLASLTQILLAIPGVEDGVFVLGEAPQGGIARLAALAVAPGLTQDGILAALRQRVDAAFLPRPLRLLAALPRNELGKLPRDAVLRLLGQGSR